MILEQIAWVYSIHMLNDDSLFKVKPTKCISKLKPLFPKAGDLYGQLSEIAHISPENTLQYIQNEKGQLNILLTSYSESEFDALKLLFLADMYVVVAEIIFADLLKSFTYTKRAKDTGRAPKKSRPTQLLINYYYKVITSRSARRAKKDLQ